MLHNPKNDKRTTEGVFHVCEGGLPIAADKKVVPKITFLRLLEAALNPPSELMSLPYQSDQPCKGETFVSLLLRPLVCPKVEGFIEEKTHEVRFLAPGSMVCNLDFVESIFGNAGNPDLAENDAALDPTHWTGTTGIVILAPQLIKSTKKEVGLPHVSQATERQKQDGMCYSDVNELYNEGSAFKVCARDARGIVVTIIADNYFGYCKKEVKTQMSMAANLYGLTEEEHAGGCIAFPSFDLGLELAAASLENMGSTYTFEAMVQKIGDAVWIKPEGYAVDKEFDDVFYVPENAIFSIPKQTVSWEKFGAPQKLNLKPGVTYILPNGYKMEMVKKGSNTAGKKERMGSGEGRLTSWRLKGTVAEGAHCHKPSTVSGGGKSELSKRVGDMITFSPFVVQNLDDDFAAVQKIVDRSFSNILKIIPEDNPLARPGMLWWHSRKSITSKEGTVNFLLDQNVSLGTCNHILNFSEYYTDEHNAFVNSIPPHVKEIFYALKHNYNSSWGNNWRQCFHADAINGALGRELKFKGAPLIASYMRVGYRSKYDKDIPLSEDEEGVEQWKMFSLRQDFFPSDKLQTEDDITASVVVPSQVGQCLILHRGEWNRPGNPKDVQRSV